MSFYLFLNCGQWIGDWSYSCNFKPRALSDWKLSTNTCSFWMVSDLFIHGWVCLARKFMFVGKHRDAWIFIHQLQKVWKLAAGSLECRIYNMSFLKEFLLEWRRCPAHGFGTWRALNIASCPPFWGLTRCFPCFSFSCFQRYLRRWMVKWQEDDWTLSSLSRIFWSTDL